jgi:hypothetical protein
MPQKRRPPLPASVAAELHQRLYNAAEAFYFAAILCNVAFYAGGAAPNQHSSVERALEGILSSSNKGSQLAAPPLVNFAFSIELYIKLLRVLADGDLMQGHNLHDLFLELETVANDVSATCVRNHRYARGCRDDFLGYLDETKSVFEDWRYAYESEVLIAVPDNLHALADAFRATIRELHPGRRSVFEAGKELLHDTPP